MKYKIGQLLDWTQKEHDSPFYGVVAFDEDLGEVVVHRTNGGFITLHEEEYLREVQQVIEPENVNEFLESEKERFPDEDFTYIETITQKK